MREGRGAARERGGGGEGRGKEEGRDGRTERGEGKGERRREESVEVKRLGSSKGNQTEDDPGKRIFDPDGAARLVAYLSEGEG